MDTACGIGAFRPRWLQTLASKKAYVLVYGLIGTAILAMVCYFVATISTIEKRFKIPSRTSGNASPTLTVIINTHEYLSVRLHDAIGRRSISALGCFYSVALSPQANYTD
jgi:hypothetical protein